MEGQVTVLQVIAGYILRGAEVHALNLASKLEPLGFRVPVATLFESEVSEEARKRGLTVHVIRKQGRGDPRAIPRIASVARKEGARILHTHLVNGNFYGRLASLLVPHSKVVSTVHNYEEALTGFGTSVYRRFIYMQDIILARLSSKVIAVTESLAEQIVKDGIPKEKVVSILNGVDTDEFDSSLYSKEAVRRELGIGAESFVVGSAGRLVRQKRLDDLVKTIAKLRAEGVDATGMLIGDGELKAGLERLAGSLGIGEKIMFHPFTKELARIYSALDAFLLCSETETTSVVTLQAMSMKKPVVVTSVGSLPEVLSETGAGYLVDLGDTEAMAGGLKEIALDPALALKMGERGRDRVIEKFSEKAQIEKTADIYRSLR